MSVPQVAGVAVSTEHFIDGERVGFARDVRGALADRRGAPRRRRAPAAPREVDAAVDAAPPRLSRLGGARARGSRCRS